MLSPNTLNRSFATRFSQSHGWLFLFAWYQSSQTRIALAENTIGSIQTQASTLAMELEATWPTAAGKQDISGIQLTGADGHTYVYGNDNQLHPGVDGKVEGFATLKISLAQVNDEEVDLSGFTGAYTIRVNGASNTTTAIAAAANDTTSRAKLAITSGSAKVATDPYCEFALYITAAGKLSLSAIDDADAVNPSTGVEQKIYVAVAGAKTGEDAESFAKRDTAVAITLSAEVRYS